MKSDQHSDEDSVLLHDEVPEGEATRARRGSGAPKKGRLVDDSDGLSSDLADLTDDDKSLDSVDKLWNLALENDSFDQELSSKSQSSGEEEEVKLQEPQFVEQLDHAEPIIEGQEPLEDEDQGEEL